MSTKRPNKGGCFIRDPKTGEYTPDNRKALTADQESTGKPEDAKSKAALEETSKAASDALKNTPTDGKKGK